MTFSYQSSLQIGGFYVSAFNLKREPINQQKKDFIKIGQK